MAVRFIDKYSSCVQNTCNRIIREGTLEYLGGNFFDTLTLKFLKADMCATLNRPLQNESSGETR